MCFSGGILGSLQESSCQSGQVCRLKGLNAKMMAAMQFVVRTGLDLRLFLFVKMILVKIQEEVLLF